MSLNIGDIVKLDGKQVKIIEIKEKTHDDGTKVEVIVVEPI